MRTQNQPSTISNVAFQLLPGAATPVNVPDGQSRCIKVLFTAEAACGASGAPDFCYVQALIDGAPMDPNGAGFQAIDSEDATASAHAYEWVKRVGEGTHVVTIERAVGNAATAPRRRRRSPWPRPAPRRAPGDGRRLVAARPMLAATGRAAASRKEGQWPRNSRILGENAGSSHRDTTTARFGDDKPREHHRYSDQAR